MNPNNTEESRIDFKYNLRMYWNLLRPYKWYLLGAILLIIFLQTEQVVERYLLKLVIDQGSTYLNGTSTKDKLIHLFIVLGIIFLALQFIKALARWIKLTFTLHIGSNAIFDLKRKYFNHLIGLDYNFHTTHRTGALISKITRAGGAIDRLNDIFEHNTFPLVVQVIISTAAVAYFDFISAIVLLITMAIFVGYSLYIQRKQEPSNIASNDAEDHEKAQISDYFTNIDSIKHFGKEDNIKKQYHSISQRSKDTLLEYWNYYKIVETGQNLIIGIGGFFILLFPILSFLNGTTSIGTVAFIFATYTAFAGQLWEFVSGIRGFYRSMADLQPLFAYGKIKNAIKDKKNAKKIEITDGAVTFKNVSFAYNKRTIFKNFNLNINKNEKVALVGHSGSGKTTLTKLLYRLYDVDNGEILIDGKNIKDVRQESLRAELSIVPQECILFDDTIYNNILFSHPAANKKDVWQAIKFAQLDKLINRLPQKEKTIVGERGVKLSGGEKQRVSIARALLADKKILVLDEATSSLDSETEHDIQHDLKRLMEGRTSIIIAHRLSTIMHADKIVVMKNGKIVQMGNHNSLIKQKGEYQKLWKLQKGGYIK